jgi:hypothetical protein
MNSIAYMLSQTPMKKIASLEMIMQLEPFIHERLREDYER